MHVTVLLWCSATCDACGTIAMMFSYLWCMWLCIAMIMMFVYLWCMWQMFGYLWCMWWCIRRYSAAGQARCHRPGGSSTGSSRPHRTRRPGTDGTVTNSHRSDSSEGKMNWDRNSGEKEREMGRGRERKRQFFKEGSVSYQKMTEPNQMQLLLQFFPVPNCRYFLGSTTFFDQLSFL